jgi:hypothetical protein
MDEILIQDEAQSNLKDDYINCARCGNLTPDCEASDTEDGLVCEKCNEDYVSCYGCNDRLHEDGCYKVNDEDYCQSCYDDIPYCERCEHREPDMDTTTVATGGDDQEWCDCCRDDHSFWCERCEQSFSDRHHSYTRVRTMGIMCEDCCDRVGTFSCEECGDTWPDDDRAYDEDNEDDYICNHCANNGKRHIHSYSYKPAPLFRTASNQKMKSDTLYFGLELEVERDNSSIQVGKMAEDILNEQVYYMKNDGSLNNGFEIVTHPMTFEFIQEHKADVFKPMLDKLISAGYRSYDSKTCGIHIHLTKKCFTTWQLYRFIKFFLDNRDFVTAISQRNIEQLERWATIEEESNDSIVYKAKKKGGNSRRYSAVNLQNDRTIEIRIFRGTLNYLSFLKNIEFCYALFNFSRDVKETTVAAFKEYIEQSNEYAMLKKFIKTKNL